MRTATDRAHLP